MSNVKLRAALYCRISEREEGVDKTANQEAALRKLAASSGYTVAEVFVDDDISAYRGKVERPAFTRLMAAIKEGRVDVVMAVHRDRLTRGSAAENEAMNILLAQAGAVLHLKNGGVIDPSTPMVRAMLGIQDIFDGLTVDIAMEKQADRVEAEILAGELALWTRRPYGFEVEKGRVVSVRELEAEVLRDAAARLLRGESLYSIAKLWERTGVPLKGSPKIVRQTLLRERNGGWLTYKGERINQNQPAVWDPETHEAVRALLLDPSRAPKRGPKERALLSGIITCRCGATMTAQHAEARPLYKCTRRLPGPNHQSIAMHAADEGVIDAVLSHITKGALRLTDDTDLTRFQAELAENARHRKEVMAVLMDPDIRDKSDVRTRLIELEKAQTVLERDRDAFLANRAEGTAFEEFRAYFANPPEDDPAADAAAMDRAFGAWESLTHERRRAIIAGGYTVRLKDGAGLVGRDRVDVRAV